MVTKYILSKLKHKVDHDKISFECKRLNSKKASKSNEAPASIIKEFNTFF